MSKIMFDDLSHIMFAGKTPARPQRSAALEACSTTLAVTAPDGQLNAFIAWVLRSAGLDAAAYRTRPLHRRLPACLRAMKVDSTRTARELLERKPHLVTKVISSLLIGVTEFFRESDALDYLGAGPARTGRQAAAANLECRMLQRRRAL